MVKYTRNHILNVDMTKHITVEAELDTGLTDSAVEHIIEQTLVGFEITEIAIEDMEGPTHE